MRAFAVPSACLLVLCTAFAWSSVSATPPPCAHPFVPAGTQEVAVPTEGRFQTNLTLSSAGNHTVGFKAAYPANPLGGGMGRNLIAAFLENSTGDLVWGLGILSFPAGVHAVAGDASANLQAFVGSCGWFHVDGTNALPAGTYRMVVVTTSETEAAFSVFLPSAATLSATSSGPAIPVSEATLACHHKLHAQAYAAWSTNLVGCTQAFSIPNRAYGLMTLGQGPDATHEVRLTGPSGSPSYDPAPVVVGIEGGPAGTWTVEVPKYLTPLSLKGVPSYDTGVYGVFADVA